MITVRGPQGHDVTLSTTGAVAKAECTCGERFETVKDDRFDGHAMALTMGDVEDHFREARSEAVSA